MDKKLWTVTRSNETRMVKICSTAGAEVCLRPLSYSLRLNLDLEVLTFKNNYFEKIIRKATYLMVVYLINHILVRKAKRCRHRDHYKTSSDESLWSNNYFLTDFLGSSFAGKNIPFGDDVWEVETTTTTAISSTTTASTTTTAVSNQHLKFLAKPSSFSSKLVK